MKNTVADNIKFYEDRIDILLTKVEHKTKDNYMDGKLIGQLQECKTGLALWKQMDEDLENKK